MWEGGKDRKGESEKGNPEGEHGRSKDTCRKCYKTEESGPELFKNVC